MIAATTGLSVIEKWRRTTPADRALLCEAMVSLVLSSLAIALTRFRFIARTAAWSAQETLSSPEERLVLLRRVRRAILACARRAPCRAVCFQQGLAAHWMLRRRGVPSVLFFGAALGDEKKLAAHVWVRVGDFDVTGGESASRFAVLLAFPPQSPRSR